MLNQDEMQKAAAIQARMQRALSAVDNNADLNQGARRRERARAVLQAQNDMRQLRAMSDAREQDESGKAYRAAFGLDPARSAEDRAIRAELAADDTMGPDGAMGAMLDAMSIGDDLKARALAQRAYDYHRAEPDGPTAGRWLEVLGAYGDSSTSARTVVDGVLDAGARPDKLSRLRDRLSTEVVVPSDLQYGSLESIAADGDSGLGGTGS